LNKRIILGVVVGAIALSAALGAAWILSLPPAAAYDPPPIAKEESDAILAALRPPRPRRPLVAIVGINNTTETTDYLMPYGILKRADVADVVMLATEPARSISSRL
jgi:hypothetical protein